MLLNLCVKKPYFDKIEAVKIGKIIFECHIIKEFKASNTLSPGKKLKNIDFVIISSKISLKFC
jgi:hypothetical protein